MKTIPITPPPDRPINGMREQDYITATRTTKVTFKRQPSCLECKYYRSKSGLAEVNGKLERYTYPICVLTYEPLEFAKIPEMVGDVCPLEFKYSKCSEYSDKQGDDDR